LESATTAPKASPVMKTKGKKKGKSMEEATSLHGKQENSPEKANPKMKTNKTKGKKKEKSMEKATSLHGKQEKSPEKANPKRVKTNKTNGKKGKGGKKALTSLGEKQGESPEEKALTESKKVTRRVTEEVEANLNPVGKKGGGLRASHNSGS